MKPRILIIDQYHVSSSKLKKILLQNNFEVCIENDRLNGLQRVKNGYYNLCIIDSNTIMTGDFLIVEKIRQIDSQIPIFFFSFEKSKKAMLQAYTAGIDDYFTKPFDLEITLIKINNIIKKTSRYINENYDFELGKFYFNYKFRTLNFQNNSKVTLTPKESELLRLLASNINDYVSKSFALRLIWEKEDYFTAISMDVYIWRLRNHLKQDSNIKLENIYSSGFRLTNNNL